MSSELPKGYICVCGVFHQFAVWVYAHWHIPIDATCDKCGQHNTIVRGVRINDRRTKGKDHKGAGDTQRPTSTDTSGISGT